MRDLFLGSQCLSNVEFPIRTRDGAMRFWSFNTSSPGALRDGRRFIVGMAVDMTERKRMEEELRMHRDHLEAIVEKRTVELGERNRKLNEEIAERLKAEKEKRAAQSQLAQTQRIEALDRFAGGIAHDLNNILYPILINIEELLAEAPVESPQHELLEQTMKSVIRQKDLIKKILSFSRRTEEELKPVKVAPLVEEALDFLRSTLPSSMTIKQQIDASSDMVVGDPTQIQQVILNLIQNAADSFPTSKGSIEVRLTNTHLEPIRAKQSIKANTYLVLTVKDAGSGIPPDVLNHIFEPFYTTKGVGKGSGMGLSVVYGIMKRHGGTINVQSRPGEGTIFTAYLPAYSGEAHVQAASPEPGHPGKAKERILLVDDEEYILSSLQRVLKMSGYRVVAVKDGVEALRLFQREPDGFDLIITDLTMPEMTGVELARKVRKIRSGMPVVLSTGFNDSINEQEAHSLGIHELLFKPVDSKELKKIVRRALEH
jgi:signal transduction histidine kinase